MLSASPGAGVDLRQVATADSLPAMRGIGCPKRDKFATQQWEILAQLQRLATKPSNANALSIPTLWYYKNSVTWTYKWGRALAQAHLEPVLNPRAKSKRPHSGSRAGQSGGQGNGRHADGGVSRHAQSFGRAQRPTFARRLVMAAAGPWWEPSEAPPTDADDTATRYRSPARSPSPRQTLEGFS